MALISLLVGVLLAVAVTAAALKSESQAVRKAGAFVGLLFIILGFLAGSIVYVSPDKVGIISKNAFGARLDGSKIIATSGEMGIQARTLPPGWHLGYWPIIFEVRTVPLTEIKSDEVGIIETADGLPVPTGELFAPEWSETQFQQMLDAEHFLTAGKGFKGKQTSVLKPGKYRLNTELYKVRMVKQTEVKPGEVAVLKSNFGKPASVIVRGVAGAADPAADGTKLPEEKLLRLGDEGEMGIRAAPLLPGKYAINTDAFEVTEIWTTQMIAHYTAAHSGNPVSSDSTDSKTLQTDEREIRVTTSDGFQFPVDVRVEYYVEPQNAPIVVAKLGDDEGERFRNVLNSAVRAIFRNNAESVRALDYVQQRSHQESQSLTMLRQQMAVFGVSISAVRIGNVGDQQTLGKLLETQTQREIAKQEQVTIQEQQKAAEQKKLLAKATQEAEEEKRLATATYEVKIADETMKKRVKEAEGEAEATEIKAKAQADAYRQIAEQIGKSNAALIELLKIVGERNIQITPRILITGSGTDTSQANTALIGTMLDRMIADEEKTQPARPTTPPQAPAQR